MKKFLIVILFGLVSASAYAKEETIVPKTMTCYCPGPHGGTVVETFTVVPAVILISYRSRIGGSVENLNGYRTFDNGVTHIINHKGDTIVEYINIPCMVR
jgi:hypothetical protein